MDRLDVVNMYKKGYPIEYIIDTYYRVRTKFDEPVQRKGNIFIIKKKSVTKAECKKQVYNELYKYVN